MKKKDVLKDMREFLEIGAFITPTQLARYLKIGRHKGGELEKYIMGLDYMPDGRGNKYFTVDVAARIVELSVKGGTM